jgi:hypothetical protein
MDAIQKLIISIIFLIVAFFTICLGIIFLMVSVPGFLIDIIIYILTIGNGLSKVGLTFIERAQDIFQFIPDLSKRWFNN